MKFELFTASTKAEGSKTEAVVEGEQVDVFVVLDGVTTKVKVNKNGKSILDAALDAGLDAPFSCLGGVCCTADVRWIKGQHLWASTMPSRKMKLRAVLFFLAKHIRLEMVLGLLILISSNYSDFSASSSQRISASSS